ncbi:ATP-grasp peptide maturase system methyltransferase [Nocardiopsis sp. EMB25]|uniref:ATP-grasp peptide maturase system methyltransferase n=1 Tax=Nocardiopsis sp. EMB25 TaxID=2835867 RepID=UPI002283FBC1|nr:ATP-grasp peptide maturase system methyltransferase [Nocardiopsis sp. EMB25]MCY9787055.1 ATP-grasp peptide maturase system methyltransferase [Nocardiopsis sp. EMB25]
MTGAVHPPSSVLTDQLAQAGVFASGSPLAEVFRRVDRGAFVPAFATYANTPQGTRYRLVRRDVAAQREEWSAHVYADETLIIEVDGRPIIDALPDGVGGGRATSSSTMPSLMARMLDELEVDDKPRVLEIGVGSGYNAAILSEYLGSDRVTSIDISPRLVSDATERLARAGYHPVVAEYDGHKGYADRAPHDRIISTTAFTHVPPAWIDQVTPGGLVLVNIAGGTGGAMLKLRVGDDGRARGRFLPEWAGFMPARSHTPRTRVTVDDEGESGVSALDPSLVSEPAFAFVAQLATVDAHTVLRVADDGTEFLALEGADGAWAEVDTEPADGGFAVSQGGPRRLWSVLEATHAWWVANGEPDWSHFGVTVHAEDQWVWFQNPDGPRWPLT